MSDSDRPDDAPPSGRPRGYVPVPGVIDLDAVESDARDALWGDEAAALDAEDDLAPIDEDLPSAPPPSEPAPEDPPHPPTSPLPGGEGEGSPPQPTTADDLAPRGAPAPLSFPWDEPLRAERGSVPESSPPAATSEPPAPPAEPPAKPPPPSTPASAATPPDDPLAYRIPPQIRPPEAVVETAKTATKDTGRELVALVTEYGKRHLPETQPRTREADTGPPRLVGRIGQLIPILRVVPWLLGAAFAASFVWDFPNANVVVPPLDLDVPLEGLLRILAVSGLIGFLTNWLAITMLFQPREKRAIIPQGLIPAQRERVIYRLSQAISQELINADIIKQRIQASGVIGRYRDLGLDLVRGVVEDPDFRADLKTLAQRYAQNTLGSESLRRELAQIAVDKVEEQAGQGLGGVALKLYRTFAEDDFQRRVDNALAELPQAVTPLLDRIDQALDAVPAKVEAKGDEIEEAATKAVLSFVESFDIQAMIQEKARGFDEAQLESLLKSTSNEQLNYIKYLGGILGVFGGLVIWRAEMLIVFVAIGLVLWALDEVLVRAR